MPENYCRKMEVAKLTGNMIDNQVEMPQCLDWLDIFGPQRLCSPVYRVSVAQKPECFPLADSS